MGTFGQASQRDGSRPGDRPGAGAPPGKSDGSAQLTEWRFIYCE
ncbi:hypothetical protein [Azospirillum palustre]